MILGNDGGGTVSLQRRPRLVDALQPADRRVLPRHRRQPDALPRLRRAAGQHDDVVPSRSNHDAITVTEWYEIGGGESGYIAVRPDNPNIVYAGCYQGYPDPLRPRARPAARHHRLARGVLRLGRQGLEVPLQLDLADDPLAARPEHPLHRRATSSSARPTRARVGSRSRPDLTRNDPETLAALRRADHQGQHRRRGLRHGLHPRRVAARRRRPLGRLRRRPGPRLPRRRRDLENVTPPDAARLGADLASSRPRRTTPATAYLAATRYKLRRLRSPTSSRPSDYGKTWTKITTGIPDDDFTRVDPRGPERQRAALRRHRDRASTSRSTTAANWQHGLGGNFPVVPIHDLVVNEDDLVVGTHGRSLLDPRRPRRCCTSSATRRRGGATQLFRPRDTIRYGAGCAASATRRCRGELRLRRRHDPGLQVRRRPATARREVTCIDAGNNPPDGVIAPLHPGREADRADHPDHPRQPGQRDPLVQQQEGRPDRHGAAPSRRPRPAREAGRPAPTQRRRRRGGQGADGPRRAPA